MKDEYISGLIAFLLILFAPWIAAPFIALLEWVIP